MASRMMHLAVSAELEKQLPIKDKNRFRIGHILPDAIPADKSGHRASHFKAEPRPGKRMMDFERFYRQFEDRITDELYLGYYFHLIQDAIYRKLMYEEWKIVYSTDVRMILYQDYRILNGVLARRYGLADDLTVPEHFSREKILAVYPFELDFFLQELAGDFAQVGQGKLTFLTEARAEQYVEECAAVCLQALAALSGNGPRLDPTEYAWEALRE